MVSVRYRISKMKSLVCIFLLAVFGTRGQGKYVYTHGMHELHTIIRPPLFVFKLISIYIEGYTRVYYL